MFLLDLGNIVKKLLSPEILSLYFFEYMLKDSDCVGSHLNTLSNF